MLSLVREFEFRGDKGWNEGKARTKAHAVFAILRNAARMWPIAVDCLIVIVADNHREAELEMRSDRIVERPNECINSVRLPPFELPCPFRQFHTMDKFNPSSTH